MTSGNRKVVIQKANIVDLGAIKQLADQHKVELGFIVRGALEKSIQNSELLIALNEQSVLCGFVQYRHRKDEQTTLYNLLVGPEFRQRGIGRKLINALVEEAKTYKKERIVLKCPTDLRANHFYSSYGFILIDLETGKHRSLNVWQLQLV